MKQTKEIPLEILEKLKQIELPAGWEVSKLTVEFKKPHKSYPIQSTHVVYDVRNDCFYAQTARGYIYPDESETIKETLAVMQKANKILKESKNN